jgi:hypothetical protein
VDGFVLQQGSGGYIFAHAKAGLLDEAAAEALTRGVFQFAGMGLVEQDGGRIYTQLGDGLGEQNVHGETQVQTCGQGIIDNAQSLQALQTLFGLFMQGNALNGAGGNIAQGGEQAKFGWCEGWLFAPDPQSANRILARNEGHGCYYVDIVQ